MARKCSLARLVVALSVAAVLAVFLLYTSIAGQARPTVTPGTLACIGLDVPGWSVVRAGSGRLEWIVSP